MYIEKLFVRDGGSQITVVAEDKYGKTSLNQPTMGPILNGPFREVIGLGSLNIITMNGIVWVIVRDPNKAVGLWRWSFTEVLLYYCLDDIGKRGGCRGWNRFEIKNG